MTHPLTTKSYIKVMSQLIMPGAQVDLQRRSLDIICTHFTSSSQHFATSNVSSLIVRETRQHFPHSAVSCITGLILASNFSTYITYMHKKQVNVLLECLACISCVGRSSVLEAGSSPHITLLVSLNDLIVMVNSVEKGIP